MVNIVRGSIVNNAISQMILAFFESRKDIEGNLFLGYPILPTREDKYSIDALLVSPFYGIVIFHFYDDIVEKNLEEIHDEIYSAMLSKLAKEKKLVKRQNVLINMNIITLAPNWRNSYNLDDDGYNACNSTDKFNDYLMTFTTVNNEEYYKLAMRCIQSIGTIKKILTREKVIKENSKGAILKNLEKTIANLDKIQTSAALEISNNVQRIRGLAGSGKTIVLALKAAYLHVAHPDWKIAVTFNTRSLKQQFIDLITRFTYEQTEDTPNWKNINVIHAWGSTREEGLYYNFCMSHDIEYLDYNNAKVKSSASMAFDFACREALANTNEFKSMYDVILIDEAQDFSSDYLRLCYSILPEKKRLVYAYDELQSLTLKSMDSPQQIFGVNLDGSPKVILKNSDDNPKEDIILKTCYRNSRPLLASAHALGFRIYGELIQMFDESSLWLDIGYIVESGELADDKKVALKRTTESSPPFLENHSSIDELITFEVFGDSISQAKWIASQIYRNIHEDELEYKDILVIHTDPMKTRSDVGIIRNELSELNINSHLAGVTTSPDQFFMDDSITFTSIFRAKGNEAAMVYVIDSQNCGSGYATAKSRNILFTAITRSKAWVRVSGYGSNMQSLKDEFEEIKRNDFKLVFVYPNANKRKELNIIHRDKSKDEESRIEKNVSNLSNVLLSLEKGDMYWEDIPKSVKDKLRELIGNG